MRVWRDAPTMLAGCGECFDDPHLGSLDRELNPRPGATGDPVQVQDIHATLQHALGINPEKELITPVGRPLALSDGRVLGKLLKG